MAYKRTKWVDHVVEHPNTYTETANSDGTITHTPAPGEVIAQGTPISATNLNKLEEELQHVSVAYDMLSTIMYAQVRALEKRLSASEAATAALIT